MTDEKSTTPKNGTKQNPPKVGQDAYFRKGGYQPVEAAPAKPVPPSAPATSQGSGKTSKSKDTS